MEKEILSTGECAEKKGVSRQAVTAAIQRGDLKAVRVGRNYTVKREDCEAWQPDTGQAKRGKMSAESRKQNAPGEE